MSAEWFELAWINFTKAILHGQYIAANGAATKIEQVLTEEQREQVYKLNDRHADELERLLRSFVQGEQQ
jgi:hypothetical protein